eukprot:snap_masked-scaffold_12-processed-gene-3.46-mRNA-1 protein AED:1.00 eAED:1.00 QI:0/-1/0/0/-1/1/1/0/212
MSKEKDKKTSHRLESSFTFFCMKRNQSRTASPADYADSIIPLFTFSTAEAFLSQYLRIALPTKFPFLADIHIFRAGIKPVWEDKSNKEGGKIVIRVSKQGKADLIDRYWEALCFAFIGEKLDPDINEVTGIIASIRSNEVQLSIWLRNSSDQDIVNELKERMKEILELPSFVRVEYRKHGGYSNTNYNKQNQQDRSKEGVKKPAWRPSVPAK